MTELVLAYNRITDAGCDALAGLLEKTRSLVRVDLAFNDFGPAGAEKLSNSMLVRTMRPSAACRGCHVSCGSVCQG